MLDGLHVSTCGDTESSRSTQEEFKDVALELELLASLHCLLLL